MNTESISQDEKTMALLAHLGGIFFGFIPSLIIWLIKKDESAFVAEQAKEALNFQITVMIGFVISFILLPASFVASSISSILLRESSLRPPISV